MRARDADAARSQPGRRPRHRTLRAAGLALLLAVVPLAVAHVCFSPMYQTNDDVGLDMLARGTGLATHPTPYLLRFSSVLYGSALTGLYALAGGVPWYRILQLAIQLAATVTIATCVLRRGLTPTRLLLLGAYLLAFDLSFYARPHFTLTSILAGTAGVVLWLSYLEARRPLGRAGLAGVVGWLGVSALLRDDGPLLVLLLALPPLAVSAWRAAGPGQEAPGASGAASPPAPRLRPALRSFAAPLALAALVLLALGAYEQLRYRSDPGWRTFQETEDAIIELVDFERATWTEQTRPVFERVGWSRNDFAMLLHWFFLDPELYSAEKMRQVLDAFPPARVERWENLSRRVEPFAEDPAVPLMLAAALLPVLFVARGRRLPLAAAGASLLLASAYLVFVLHRFPPHVYQPMLGLFCCAGMVLADEEFVWAEGARSWLQVAGFAVFLGLLPSALESLRREAETMDTMNAELRAAVSRLDPQPDELYVVWGASFPYELIRPTSDMEWLRDMKLLGLDTATQSPLTTARLEQFGIEDLYRAIFSRDDVFVICEDANVARFVTYAYEHYGAILGSDPVAHFDMRGSRFAFDVHRFVRADPERNLARFAGDPARFRRELDLELQVLAAWNSLEEGYRRLGVPLRADGSIDMQRVEPAEIHWRLGMVYTNGAMWDRAEHHFRSALRIDPGHGRAHLQLGQTLLRQGRTDAALEELREAARLMPDSFRPLAALAWVRATHPDPGARDATLALDAGHEAVARAPDEPAALDALAAAYAEAGRFDEAVAVAARALERARANGSVRLAAGIAERLAGYRAGRPHREAVRDGPGPETAPPRFP